MPDPGNYWASDKDPYLDPKTGILKNIPGLETQKQLDAFEETLFQANFPAATTYAELCRSFSFRDWQEIHKICFSDIYEWAGSPRAVRISKGKTVFAYPETIVSQSAQYFNSLNDGLKKGDLTFEKCIEIYAELNVIHPFREGNGRTQRILFAALLKCIGYEADYTLLNGDELIVDLLRKSGEVFLS